MTRRTLTILTVVACVVAVGAPAATPVAAQETATMTVTVEDQDGNPISGATVTASWDGDSSSGETAGNGKVFLDVPNGTQVQLTVDHPGYVRNTPVVVGEATEREYTVDVFRRGSLSLTLRDGEGPLERARVIVRKGDTRVLDRTTNAQGEVETGPIEYGEYNVFVQKPGYPTTERTVTVNGTNERSFTIESRSVTVEFRVRDDFFDTPRPVSGATVVINDGSSTVTTLDNGEATASVPVNTQVSYRLVREGYRNQSGSFRVGESQQTVNLTVQRIPAITINRSNERIVIGERVTVTVRNQYDRPVAGATVSLDGEEVGQTDSQGVVRVQISEPGEHRISASRGQTAAQTTVVGVEAATDSPTPTAEPTGTEGDDDIPVPVDTPGFGPALAVLALVGFALWARLRG